MLADALDPATIRYAEAVPLGAFTAAGLGPLGTPKGKSFEQRLANFAGAEIGLLAALDSCGATATLILGVVGAFGGVIDANRLTTETESADRDEITASIDRLVDSGLLEWRSDGDDLAFTAGLVRLWNAAGQSISMADPNAITSDALSVMCKHHGLQPGSNRKDDKIAALAELFADPSKAARIRDSLSPLAADLLDAIADTGGLTAVDAEQVGLPGSDLYMADAPRYAHLRPAPRHEGLAVLSELTATGLVGVNEYERSVFIWVEAWPLLDRPVYRHWPRVPPPGVKDQAETPVRLPAVVALYDRVLNHWVSNPAPALKNSDLRLGKQTIRAWSKQFGCDAAAVELLSGLAMTTELVLRNEVSRSGRGRNMRIESAWMVDPEALATWNALPAASRWTNLLAYWSRRSPAWGDQLLANRLYVLWELARLEPATAYESDEQLAHWIQHRHGQVGVAEAVVEALGDLRVLDVVEPDGPPALTALGRLAITDFAALTDLDFGTTTDAVVQADLTVIAPADLDPAIAARLAALSTLESDAGARIHRLDETAITRSIQQGETADSIIAFLAELSSVPVPEVVERFVTDAADQAQKLTILDAPSVLISSDPVEMATALKLKSAKLTPVTPTVALSSLAPDKLRAALDRSKLVPEMVADGSGRPAARRGSDRAAALEQRLQYYEGHQARLPGTSPVRSNMSHVVDRLKKEAADARDSSLRWRRHDSFALAPGSLSQGDADS